MLIPILGISLFKHCAPYLRKHVCSVITESEFVVLNSILIIFFVIIYANFYKNETMFKKKIKFTYYQIAGLIVGAFITCISFVKIVEYERDHSIVQMHLLLQSFSLVLFILIGYMFFNETFTVQQMIGLSLIVAGIIISS